MSDLPDELMGPGPGEPSQNGNNDPQSHNTGSIQDTSQKHQLMSQLLAPNSTLAGLTNAMQMNRNQNVPGSMTLNNVKSPLSNSLSSPPHVTVGKPGSSAQHVSGVSADANFVTSSAAFSIANNSNSGAMVTSAALKGIGSHGLNTSGMAVTMGHNQILNGPLSGPNRNLGQNLPIMSQANMIGGVSSQQMQGHANMGHPNMNAQNPQMMKVRK